MAEYYAVERSQEYLAHYGVKGMKWGVIRAKENHNSRAIDRHWRKAQKHLKKLQDRTDINKQKKLYVENRNLAISDAISAPLSVGLGYGATHLSKSGALARIAQKQKALEGIPGLHIIGDSYRDYRPWGIGMGAGYTGAAIARGVMAKKAKNRASVKGHKKAVDELNEFKSEMRRSFAGTKYGKKRKRR